mmetsp:Transcript_919/g.2236  ORF Transcript_919/g.2236 Transcript_919/m.2236 type:complete len:211 (-) Transcript_919:155-787(-)
MACNAASFLATLNSPRACTATSADPRTTWSSMRIGKECRKMAKPKTHAMRPQVCTPRNPSQTMVSRPYVTMLPATNSNGASKCSNNGATWPCMSSPASPSAAWEREFTRKIPEPTMNRRAASRMATCAMSERTVLRGKRDSRSPMGIHPKMFAARDSTRTRLSTCGFTLAYIDAARIDKTGPQSGQQSFQQLRRLLHDSRYCRPAVKENQ